MKNRKQEIITFKADASLLEAMKGIPNRSEFIRSAILSYLENACPLCKGTGILTPHQKSHLDSFLIDHPFEVCEVCDEPHLICVNRPKRTQRLKAHPSLREK